MRTKSFPMLELLSHLALGNHSLSCLLAFASSSITPACTHLLLEVLSDYSGQNQLYIYGFTHFWSSCVTSAAAACVIFLILEALKDEERDGGCGTGEVASSH